MLPTLVIGLREGLEAALIVGIIAAFLRQQGRTDLLRWMVAGVAAAVALCLAVGITLDVISRDLPQRQQEGLETVIGALAVVMVTYMVVWMRRHSRELKHSLESATAAAMGSGRRNAGRAMVVMAFLAVLREGFETVVFLLAAFNESGDGAGSSAGAGALIGIAIAVALGWGIYRGGVRLNLSRFFRATGLVLVLVAGGLVVTALHTAHEASWLDAGQGTTVDLSWLVRPGSVLASLLTGMLGVQPHPVVIEVIGWIAYVVPVGLYVAWQPGGGAARQRIRMVAALAATAAAIAAVVLTVTVPTRDATTVAAGAGLGAGAEGSAPGTGAAVVNTTHVAHVTITTAGCAIDARTFPAGALTVTAANRDAIGITEVELVKAGRIIGEKENLPPGFTGSFTVTVDAGAYSLYCPGAPVENTPLRVVGTVSGESGGTTTALLETATRDYARYVDTQVGRLVGAVKVLNHTLHGNDLAAAQSAYAAARPYYENIEPVAESFTTGSTDLDADLDARAGDVPAARWRGFHRIEKGLFATHRLDGLASYGTRLVRDAGRLQHLTEGLSYRPFELANGAQELLDEVAASKITGEEERYSHIDLLDMAGNVAGSDRAFTDLEPALTRIDPALTATIRHHFRGLTRLIDRYRDQRQPSGFVSYLTLSRTDKRSLAAAVTAVQEPLSKVASKVTDG